MDISQFEVRIPSISDLNQHITECIKKEVNKQMDAFLYRVAQGEDLSFDTLKDKYMKSAQSSAHFTTDMDSATTKDSKKKITDEEQCRARVSTGKRCSRRCKGKDTYCGGHINARPYGEL
jgi:hypothetical protein